MTTQQERMFAQMLRQYAKEPVSVEEIGGAYYCFGSELACLRVFAKYQSNGAIHNDKVRVGFSGPRCTYYVSIEKQ